MPESQAVSPGRNVRRKITNIPPTTGKKREEFKKKNREGLTVQELLKQQKQRERAQEQAVSQERELKA